MPYLREGALKINDHHVRSPVLNINRTCQTCHNWPEAELKARIENTQERHFRLCSLALDALVELVQDILIEHEHVNLLVVGWHGQFMTGHAEVLKTLIWQARCAVLLVKARPRDVFRLKVGDALA